MSVVTFFAQDFNIRPRTWHLQSQTPRFSCETTISGPDNVSYYVFAQDYNIRPRTWHLQSQTPRFSCELAISGPDNVRPHAFRARLQYQAPNMAPTISDPTLFVRAYNNDQKPSNLRQRFIFLAISQPRTFMSRHTGRLKGFIYLIEERPNVKLHFKISVNDMYLRGINWSSNGSPHLLVASRRLIFTYTTLLKPVFENCERGLPVLSMNKTIKISGVKLYKYPNKEML